MKRTRALVRIEHKLTKDPCAILIGAEIRVLDREVRRALVSWMQGSRQARLVDYSRA